MTYLLLLYRLITYNVKVIFANKFVYFVLASKYTNLFAKIT